MQEQGDPIGGRGCTWLPSTPRRAEEIGELCMVMSKPAKKMYRKVTRSSFPCKKLPGN
jgi:hypothetical protein